MMIKGGSILIILFLISSISFVLASDVLVWQGQYYTGTTFNTGTYEFNFSVYDAEITGEMCYSNRTFLTLFCHIATNFSFSSLVALDDIHFIKYSPIFSGWGKSSG